MINIRLLVFLFVINLFGTSAIAQVCNTLVITGPPAAPPSSWVSNKELIGASVEYVKNIALSAGVKNVEAKTYDTWSDALNAAEKGEIDLIFSVAFSEERQRFLNFVYPSYAGQNLIVLVRKGETCPLTQYSDLEGRKGAGGLGEVYGRNKFQWYVDNKYTLQRTDTLKKSLDLLFDHKIEYILAYENSAESAIIQKNLTGKIDIVSTYPFYAETFLAFSNRSKCSSALLPILSNEITKAKKTNMYYLLANKYKSVFKESLYPIISSVKNEPQK